MDNVSTLSNERHNMALVEIEREANTLGPEKKVLILSKLKAVGKRFNFRIHFNVIGKQKNFKG